MNKAFVREPDSTASYCPRCGSLGQPVLSETLDSQLLTEARKQLGASANFCPSASCEVAYFDDLDRTANVAALASPVFPKSPEAPVCACFGVTEQDLADDAATGRVDRIRELIARSQSSEARCSTAAANGRPCISEAQKLYLRFRSRT